MRGPRQAEIPTADRSVLIQEAFRIEYLTIAWMVIEAAVAIASAFKAGSRIVSCHRSRGKGRNTAQPSLQWLTRNLEDDCFRARLKNLGEWAPRVQNHKAAAFVDSLTAVLHDHCFARKLVGYEEVIAVGARNILRSPTYLGRIANEGCDAQVRERTQTNTTLKG